MEFINVETSLFNIVGWALLLGSAATVVVPILVWIGNFICSCLWEFIDEGDTDYKDKLTFTYPIETIPCKVEVVEEEYIPTWGDSRKVWCIKVTGKGHSVDEETGYVQKHTHKTYYRLDGDGIFATREEAERFLNTYSETIQSLIKEEFKPRYTFAKHIQVNVVSVPVGLGFLFIPTITLVAGSALLALYAMRWARRGVKLAKKVKNSLDSHIADKDAHK